MNKSKIKAKSKAGIMVAQVEGLKYAHLDLSSRQV